MRRTRWRDFLRSAIAPLCLTAGVVHAAGPLPFSEEWYRQRADDPPGVRQVEKDGKLWPPFPRPVGRKQTFKHAYHSAHYWPYPYSCEDQAYVHNLLDQQTAAGWNSATTLHDYYFNPETQDLTDAGQNHLQYITSTVPVQFRTVYVSQGKTPETGQLRTAFVESYLRGLNLDSVPPVVTKYEVFPGRPANEVDRMRTLELQSIPRPRLFTIGAAGGGSGGSGGGSAAGQGGGGGTGSGTGSTTTR